MKEIVNVWKVLTGNELEDKVWDKIHFGRCLRSAKLLLEVFEGDHARAEKCLREVYDDLHNHKGLTVTIETILKHAHAYKQREARDPKVLEAKRKERWAAEGLSPCCGAEIEMLADKLNHCARCMQSLATARLPEIKFKAV